jgi:hypothetical protein
MVYAHCRQSQAIRLVVVLVGCPRPPGWGDGPRTSPLPVDVKRVQYSLGGRRIKTLCRYQVDSGAIAHGQIAHFSWAGSRRQGLDLHALHGPTRASRPARMI